MDRNLLKMRSFRADRWIPLMACIAIVSSTACSSSSPTGVACTDVTVPGLTITVQNASGAAITDSASISVTDGSYKESYNLDGKTGGVVNAALERPGTYVVIVHKEGFAPYEADGVVVTKDACHVRTVQVLAQLQSASPS